MFLRASSLAGLILIAASAQCAVRATVDTTSVGANATVELMLEHDGQTSAEPDLSPLRQDFDVLSTSRSSNVQIVNGSMTSSVRVELSLSPKHSGQVRIPAITWGNDRSDPIVVNVSGASQGNPQTQNASPASGKVFLKTSIEPRQPYVQAEVDLTVRLYSAVPLYHADLEIPANSDVLVQQVGADRNETVVENGERYQLVERHYELFPQRSGSLTLSGPVLDAQIAVQNRMDPFGNSFKDFFGNLPFGGAFTAAKPIRLHGDDIALNVLPRPAAAGNEYWLPARDVTLRAEWRPAQGQIKAGDPMTLDLHLKAQGLTAAQLPDLNALLKLPEGLKAYPDQAKLTNDTQDGNLVGQRDQSIALIADRAGEFTIPALSVHWWDTKANEAREANLPARILSFAPGATSASSNPPLATAPGAAMPARGETRGPVAAATQKPDSGSSKQWFWVSVSLAALWAMTLVAWYLSRRQPPRLRAPTQEKRDTRAADARRRFGDACRRNDARAARSSLLEWIGASNADRRPVSLRAFAREADQPRLTRLLDDLDRACYAGGAWEGVALLETLNKLPASQPSNHGSKEQLEPLYK
jgi:oxygen tolerance protein BatD